MCRRPRALPSFSKDGSRLAFRSRIGSINPVAIPFDPVSLRAGVPSLLDTRNNIRLPSSVSPDGKQIAFFSIGESQEDLFIGSPDGSFRRVTDDPARDRAPMFTPDGRSLVFYSNRSGRWQPWIIGTDGGGLRQFAKPDDDAVYVIVSPKGDRVVFSGSSTLDMFSAPSRQACRQRRDWKATKPAARPLAPRRGPLTARASPGNSYRRAGGLPALAYDIAAHKTTEISGDESYAVQWLADGRRVVYFTAGGQLVVVDTATRARTVVDARLPGLPATDMFAISPDNRTIYYGAVRAEADIWIVERK